MSLFFWPFYENNSLQQKLLVDLTWTWQIVSLYSSEKIANLFSLLNAKEMFGNQKKNCWRIWQELKELLCHILSKFVDQFVQFCWKGNLRPPLQMNVIIPRKKKKKFATQWWSSTGVSDTAHAFWQWRNKLNFFASQLKGKETLNGSAFSREQHLLCQCFAKTLDDSFLSGDNYKKDCFRVHAKAQDTAKLHQHLYTPVQLQLHSPVQLFCTQLAVPFRCRLDQSALSRLFSSMFHSQRLICRCFCVGGGLICNFPSPFSCKKQWWW